MARSSSANAHGRAGGSNMAERLTAKYVGQECGAIITSIIYRLSMSDLYEDRAGAATMEYRVSKTFIDVCKTLERNPEWIYEIESLFEKLYDERAIEEK